MDAKARNPSRTGLLVALAAVITAGAVVTLAFLAISRGAAERRATDAADMLARDALKTFADAPHTDQLAELPVGSASIVARARVNAGGALSGAAIVFVERSDESTYEIKSTGRMDTTRGPIICSVDVRWKPTTRQHFDMPENVSSTCNGKRRAAQVASARS